MQAPLFGRHRKLIVWQSKVIHSNVDITCAGQFADGQCHDLQFLFRAWQISRLDATLRLEHRRQMCIAIEGNSIRLQENHPIEGVVKPGDILFRQAVDQINVDRCDAVLARSFDHVRSLFFTLDTIDRLLHLRIEILHAQAHPIETQLGQCSSFFIIHGARIDLDRIFARRQFEMIAQLAHHGLQFLDRQESRCATAQMYLFRAPRAFEHTGDQFELTLQIA